jgi:hypothetical protein
MSVWNEFEKPAALCEECIESVERSVILQLCTLRRQVRQLYSDTKETADAIKVIKQDFDELYQMYVELSERVS